MAKKNNMMQNMAKMRACQEARDKVKQEKVYNDKVRNLRWFSVIALVLTLVVILMFFLDWAYILRTKAPIMKEASISGFDCFVSGVSGNYTGSEIGEFMPQPFYREAPTEVVSLSRITVAAFILLIVALAMRFFASVKDKKVLDYLSVALGAVITGLLFAGYATAVSIDNTEIVKNWCGPSLVGICFVRSDVIIPALISLLALALPVIKIVRRALLRKKYKQNA